MKKLAKVLEGIGHDSDFSLLDIDGWVKAEKEIDQAVRALGSAVQKNKRYLGDNSKGAIAHAAEVAIDI